MKHLLQKAGNSFNLDNLVAILNFLEDMVILFEVEAEGIFRCIEVNPAFIKVMGMPLETVKNKRLDDFLNEQEKAIILKKYEKAITNRKTESFEINLNIFNQDRTIEMNVIPIFLEANDNCRYLICVSRDISERKRYEKTVFEAKKELNSLVQYGQGIILKVEKNGEDYFYTFCEGQLVAQFNLTPEEVIGKRPQDLFPPTLVTDIIEQYEYCWNKGESFLYEWSNTFGDNAFCWLAILSPIKENEQITSFIIYAVDILERKKTEASLIKSEKLSLIGELAAGIGHEIRNPLTSIRGFIKLMRENRDSIKDEFFEVIDSELESINRIAGELMILAKPQALEYKHINLVELLNEAIFLLEPAAFKNGVDLNKFYTCEEAIVYGDKQQLKQVFINLIKNAIEALELKTKGRIDVKCTIEDEAVFVKISDNGCGISKEFLKHIGEPFYTTKEKGTGLGLMISYRIVKNHEGSIICDSEEGKGTTFVLSIPNKKNIQ